MTTAQPPTAPFSSAFRDNLWPAILKLALVIYLPLALALLGLAYFLLKTDVDVRQQKLEVQESGEVKVAASLLIHNLEDATADLKYLSGLLSLKRYIDDGNPTEKQRLTENFRNLVQNKRMYDQIRVLDNRGMEIIRVNYVGNKAEVAPDRSLQNKGDRYFFKSTLALGEGEIYVSPLDLNVEHGKIEIPYKPTQRLGTPLFDRHGKRRGILLLNYLGKELLDDYIQAMGDNHHAMLLNRNGYWLHHPDPAFEWGFMFGRDDTFGKSYPEEWARISRQTEGRLSSHNGLITFATVHPGIVARYELSTDKSASNASETDDYWKVVSLVPAHKIPAMTVEQYPLSFALSGFGLAALAVITLYLSATLLSRRQLRRAIFENEEHLKEITSTLAEGIFVVDTNGLLTFVNPEAELLLGFASTELIGKNAHQQLHYRTLEGSPHPEEDCAIYEVLRTGKTYRSDAQIFWRKDGSYFHVDLSASPIRRDGKISGAVVAFSDISKQKQAEQELARSETLFHMVFNNVADAIVIFNVGGRFAEVNQVFCERMGYSREELLNLFPGDINDAEGASKFSERVTDLKAKGKMTVETVHICKDGRRIPVEVSARMIEYNGKPATLAVIRDISERIKLQAEETLLRHIDQQVIRSNSLPALLQFICDELVRLFGYHFVWLGKKEDGGEFSIAAQSGKAAAYLQELQRIGVRWDGTPLGKGPAGTCVRSGQLQVFKISESSFQPWHDAAMKFGFKSIAGIPLIVRGEVYGALMLYSQLEHDFDDTLTLQRLSSIASRICVALETSMDQEQLRLLSSALASAGNSIFITTPDGRIQWVNPAFTKLTGYSEVDAIGNTPSLLKSGKQDAAYYKALWETICNGKTWSSETVERHKTGMLFTVQQTITPILDDQGNITHFISILDDITAQKEIASRIEYMAHFDALTALPNRALFHDRLRQVLAQAKRDSLVSALMFIDLDRFKAVNDTLGHHIGDLLLKAVAERLSACVRETDTVSRLAGDEFTVLLPHVHGREDAARIAEKITAALAQPFHLEGHEVNIGSSTGIAFYPADADSDEALIRCADNAMYAAKEQGRGIFHFYQPPA